MVYVSSDWHGWSVSPIKQLLAWTDFGNEDNGRCDRPWKRGHAIAQWLTLQPNVQLILGNHDAMLLLEESLLPLEIYIV